jgi:hypothetical protein
MLRDSFSLCEKDIGCYRKRNDKKASIPPYSRHKSAIPTYTRAHHMSNACHCIIYYYMENTHIICILTPLARTRKQFRDGTNKLTETRRTPLPLVTPLRPRQVTPGSAYVFSHRLILIIFNKQTHRQSLPMTAVVNLILLVVEILSCEGRVVLRVESCGHYGASSQSKEDGETSDSRPPSEKSPGQL